MDFTLSPRAQEACGRIREFVETRLFPLERDPRAYDEHENINAEHLEPLKVKAKELGLWSVNVPEKQGGRGFSLVETAACYEEMNRSIFGPVCFNGSAPDDGNMRVLNQVLPDEKKAAWLQPIIDGKIRSSFVMTEPHPGSGSDPMMMRTTAIRKGDKWIVNGRKWFITGAGAAKVFILIARTSDDPRRGLSAFLHRAEDPGWRIVRRIPIMGPEEHGGHCEILYEGMEIAEENRLLEIGDGLRLTQIRLGPARLTHCMRWLGLARRALEIAREYVTERESFGTKLAEHEGVQWMLGEAAAQITAGRLLVMHAAWKLDQGDYARNEVSLAKIAVADTLHKAVDVAIQLNGARGYSKDTVLEWMYRYARQARLVDGASEVHNMVLARNFVKQGTDYWTWG